MSSSSSARMTALFFSFLLLLISSANSFSLLGSGDAPHDFQRGDPLQVKVKKLSSRKTLLPYDYYNLRYCQPDKIVNSAKTLGEFLRGDRIENSMCAFHMRKEEVCKVACRIKLGVEGAKNLKKKIEDEFRVNMMLDNLPVVVPRQIRDGSQSITSESGFLLGFKGYYAGSKEETYFIYNHLSVRVLYHKDPKSDSARIVGFEVTPHSIHQEWNWENWKNTTCGKNTGDSSTGPQEVGANQEIVFTYDVSFMESEVKWESRRDTHFMKNDNTQFSSFIHSLMNALSRLSSGMVLLRSVGI